MPDEADLGCDRAEEIRLSQIAQQLNQAQKTQLEPRSDGTCLNECGDDAKTVILPPTPEAVAEAAASGIEAQGEARKSVFCSKECAADYGKRMGRSVGIETMSEAI